MALSYQYNLIRKSQATLIVDGNLETASMIYPKWNQMPSKFYIGCSPSEGDVSNNELTNCLTAQFGTIMLLKEEIGLTAFSKILKLGSLCSSIYNNER